MSRYLVIQGSAESIRWMNVTAYLKTRKNTKSKQITFDGEKLDAPAVWRLRDRYIKRAHAGADALDIAPTPTTSWCRRGRWCICTRPSHLRPGRRFPVVQARLETA
jgi:hypothetical protein